jgi:hypothetical protein
MLYAPKVDPRWRDRQTDSHDLRTGYPFSYVVRNAAVIAVCSQIHTKHINTLCGQNVELLKVKLAVHIVTAVRYI